MKCVYLLLAFLNVTVFGYSKDFGIHCQQWCYKKIQNVVVLDCCNKYEKEGFCQAECTFERNLDLSHIICNYDSNCPTGYKCCSDNCTPYYKICKPVVFKMIETTTTNILTEITDSSSVPLTTPTPPVLNTTSTTPKETESTTIQKTETATIETTETTRIDKDEEDDDDEDDDDGSGEYGAYDYLADDPKIEPFILI